MRFELVTIALLLAASLGGCGELRFGQVQIGSLPKPEMARIVYGIDASAGPLQVALEYHAIGADVGTCAPFTKARRTKGVSGIEYFAFDVTPGLYTVSVVDTSPGLTDANLMMGYWADTRQQTFIGTFRLRSHSPPDLLSLMARQHDLNVAKAELGKAAEGLELAPASQVESHSWAVCPL